MRQASAYSENVGMSIAVLLLRNVWAIRYIASVAPLVTHTSSGLMPSIMASSASREVGEGSGYEATLSNLSAR